MMGRQDRDQCQLFYEFNLDEVVPTSAWTTWARRRTRGPRSTRPSCRASCRTIRRSL